MISQLTQENVAEYASNAEYIAEPLGENYTKGAVVGKTIPAKWWNWLFNAVTKRITQAFADNTGIFNELKNTVVDAGLTPDAADSTQVAQSIKLASAESLRQFFLDKQKPYGKNWAFHDDAASISVPDGYLTGKNVVDWNATVERVDNFWFLRVRLKGEGTTVGNYEVTFYTVDKGAHWHFIDGPVVSAVKNGSHCYALCLRGNVSDGSNYPYISILQCGSNGASVLSNSRVPSGYVLSTADTTVASGTLAVIGNKYVALLVAKTPYPYSVTTLLGAVFDPSISLSNPLTFNVLKTATPTTSVSAFEPSIQAYIGQLVGSRYYVAGGFCDANGENWDFSIAENLKTLKSVGQYTVYCFDIGRVSIPGNKHIYVRARGDSEQTADADYAIEDAEGNLSYVKASDINAYIINIFPDDCILASRGKTIEGHIANILLRSTDGVNFSEVLDNGVNVELFAGVHQEVFKANGYYFCSNHATRDFVNWISLPLHRLDSGDYVMLYTLPRLQGLLDGMYPSGMFLSRALNVTELRAPSSLQFNTVHPEYEGKQLYTVIKGISSNFYDTVELIDKPTSDQTGLILRDSFADEKSFYAFLTELKGYSSAYEVTTDSQGYITQLKINKFTLFTVQGINRVSGYTLYLR